MVGTSGPAADTRVALKAVASIDRLIDVSNHDLFLKDILKSAAAVLCDHLDSVEIKTHESMAGRSSLLH